MEHEETSPEAVYSEGNHSCGSLKLKFALTDSPEISSSSNHSSLDLSIDVHSDSELILTPPKADELIEEIFEDRRCTRTTKTLGQRSVRGKPAVSPPVAKEQRDFFDSCCDGTNHVYPKQSQGYDHVQEFTSTSARKHNRRNDTAKSDELLVYNMSSVTTRRGFCKHKDEHHTKVTEDEESECIRLPPMMEQQDTRRTDGVCEDAKMDRIGLRFPGDSIQQKECVIKLLRLSLHLLESSQSDYFPFGSLVSLMEKDSKVASEKMEKKHHRELLKVKEEHKKDIIDLQDRMLKWMCSRIDVVHQQENTIHQLDRELESMRSICFKLKKGSSQMANKGTQSVAPIDSSGCASCEDSKRIYGYCRKSMDAKDGASHCDADYNNKLKCRKGAETNTAIVRQPNAAIHGEQDSVVSRLTIYDTATAEKLFKDICYNSSTKGYDSNYFIQPSKKSGHADDGCSEEEFVDALSDGM